MEFDWLCPNACWVSIYKSSLPSSRRAVGRQAEGEEQHGGRSEGKAEIKDAWIILLLEEVQSASSNPSHLQDIFVISDKGGAASCTLVQCSIAPQSSVVPCFSFETSWRLKVSAGVRSVISNLFSLIQTLTEMMTAKLWPPAMTKKRTGYDSKR